METDIILDANVLLTTESYLKERAERASTEKFRAALAVVPDTAAEDCDRL
jgi:hypothetical protein